MDGVGTWNGYGILSNMPRGTCDPGPNTSCQDPGTAAEAISYLRNTTFTGYQDIEETMLDLVKVAEPAWI